MYHFTLVTQVVGAAKVVLAQGFIRSSQSENGWISIIGLAPERG